MASNMLYVPLRTTEPVDMVTGISNIIDDLYEQHPDKFKTDIVALAGLRTAAITPKSTLNELGEYFVQLSKTLPKFPYDTQIEFVWNNTLGYATRAAVSNTSMHFERINVLYNIGALYSFLGLKGEGPRTSEQGLKESFNYYKYSAGAFRYLIDEVLPEFREVLPIGLEPDTLECLYYLCLSQAQESFWQKAAMGATKNSLIAKLSFQVSECYAKSLEHANRSPTVRSEWVHHIACKRYHFYAAGQYRLALDCLDKGAYGEEVARLKSCVESCEEGLASSKYVVAPVLEDLQGLYKKAKNDYKRAEKDNDLIYLKIVPNVLPEYNAGDIIAKPTTPPVIQDTYRTRTLFGDLLPHALYQASKAYFQKLQDFIRQNFTVPAETLTHHLHEELVSRGLPGCLSAIEDPKGIPHDLFEKSENVKRHDGLRQLNHSIEDVLILSKRCRALLDETREILDKEAAEDNYMRTKFGTNNWIIAPSLESGSSLYQKYEAMNGFLNTAVSSDELVRQKFDQVKDTIAVLEKGKNAIEPFIPNTSVVNLGRPLKRSLFALREHLSKVKCVEREREHYISSMKFMSNNVDLVEAFRKYYQEQLIAEDPSAKVEPGQFEPAYEIVLEQFRKDFTWLDRQETDQNRLVQGIDREMKIFTELSVTESSVFERQNAIQYLEIAYFKYTEIRGNLEEGTGFYNTFLQQLNGFVQACKEFVRERRMEAGNLEEALVSGQPIRVSSTGLSDNGSELAAPLARHPGGWDLGG